MLIAVCRIGRYWGNAAIIEDARALEEVSGRGRQIIDEYMYLYLHNTYKYFQVVYIYTYSYYINENINT